MVDPPRHHAFAEHSDFASRTGPRRRDSDWGGHPRSHEEDLAWAAKRAAVSIAAATIHARGGATGAHCDAVVELCDVIADELGVYGHDRAELLAAAQLHDIGEVAIPQEVLEKPAALDDREWALIREHTAAGERVVQSVGELHEVARMVRHSHERWDGAGYPDGLSGEQIPLGSRIVFCADAFHAIRSDRPYRRGRTAGVALKEVNRGAGSQFDPKVADALVKSADRAQEGGSCAVTAPRPPPAFASHRDTVTERMRAGEPFAEIEAAIERTDLEDDAKSALWLVAFLLGDSQARPTERPPIGAFRDFG